MTLLDHGYRIEVVQALRLGGPPGTMFKASVYKHGWSKQTGKAGKGAQQGVALLSQPVVDGREHDMIPALLEDLARLWRAADGMENVHAGISFPQEDVDTPLEAAVRQLIDDFQGEHLEEQIDFRELREDLCSKLPGGHDWERLPKSDQASRCKRCEKVSGK